MPEHKVLVIDNCVQVRYKLVEACTGCGDWVCNDGALCLKGVDDHQYKGEENVCGQKNGNHRQGNGAGFLHFHYISTSLLLEIRT